MSHRDDYGKRHRHRESGWGSSKFIRPHARHPPGRQIGLFYRDRQMKNPKKNRTQTIHLKIPKPVISKLISNLKYISKLAAENNIEIVSEQTYFVKKEASATSNEIDKQNPSVSNKVMYDGEIASGSKNAICDEKNSTVSNNYLFDEKDHVSHNNLSMSEENKSDTDSVKEPNPKQIKMESNWDSDSTPSSSLDYVPIIPEKSNYGVADSRVLNLRGAGDFKYGYNDIITGTFREKLEERLAKGINITSNGGDVESLNLIYYEERINNMSKSNFKNMLKFRETLPAYKKTEQLLEVINNNQVVVISGETGCGKSTQVPQIILDDAIMNKKGANVKILVTQPRRIAASSLAYRVAQERAEKLGTSVGYAVRLENVDCRPRGSIMFCTTGILLVDLEVNQSLSDYSHVILDEVHERDTHVDFAMCMLKQVLEKRKDLKLILMSATLDAEKLCAYFDNCPMMHIEGLAYPVKDIYLEEILHLTNFQLKEERIPQRPRGYRGRRFDKGNREQMEKGIQYRAEIAPWLESIKRSLDPSVYRTLQDHRIEELNTDLIFEVIKYICRGPPGAILVFLPGIGDITKLLRMLNENQSYLGSKCEIHPIHSKLSTIDQYKIFERPPNNIRKIILATNIAETSITIDDIVYVVDCGKLKYHGLNVEHYFSTLKTEWASQANLRQRRGRAGRCQPGVCYHLVTSYRASKLEERLLPELQRSNLLEPVLTIKRLRLGKAAEALKGLPDAPDETTIAKAVLHLQKCGALDDNETLTPLGWHLARLPVHPAAGKLLLFGTLFGCLDRAASVAAVWSFKDPFLLIIDKEVETKEAKRSLALGEPSDHIAISEAIIQWEQCDPQERKSFAYSHFLSQNTLELLSDMKRQLGDNLRQMGFLSTGRVTSSWENRNAGNLSLFKAIVAAALYPNITGTKWKNLNARNPNKQVGVSPRTPEGPVAIHPSSVMCPPKSYGRPQQNFQLCLNPGANWLVYWLKQKSSDLFLIDVTLVYTLPLLFFGECNVSETEDDPDSWYVSITSYRVQMLKETAKLIFKLRSLLDQVLASKIMVGSEHSIKYNQFEEEVFNAVIEVITAEDEQAEYLDGTDSDTSECDSRY
ncbi:hypothetical protein ABMA27_005015 [Loxostege sticticalis]|uniref:RNA helicase n=1 Tax=Loxostege sticticalis TaxID=481309 RepID=A0ABR3HLK1_LOXSC